MGMREGLAALGGLDVGTNDPTVGRGDQILVARVYYTLLDDDPVKLKEMNIPSGSLGFVQCRVVSNGFDINEPMMVAQPLNSTIKKFPLQNELITILPAQTITAYDGKGNNYNVYYYLDVVGVWDSPEHNAIPDNSFFDRSSTNIPDVKSYKLTTIGSPKLTGIVTNDSVTGKFFNEKGNIHKLKHLPGDLVVEGRFGNGIRIGSSNTLFKDTPWKGENGNPVIIIRNGQRNISSDTWVPEYEDINKDGSIIGFFSNQTIDFEPANNNFKSYNVSETIKEKQNIVKTNANVITSSFDNINTNDDKNNVYKTQAAEVNNTSSIDDEINFIPDSENDYQYTKEFEDVLITERNNDISFKPFYNIDNTSTIEKNNGRFLKREFLLSQIKKGNYSSLPVRDYVQTNYTIVDLANILKGLLVKTFMTKNVARSILATAINEQGDPIRGFNYNLFGIHSDIDKWSLGPKFPNIKFDGQVFAIEGKTKIYRGYVTFSNITDAILFISDAFVRKGFDGISYSENDSIEYSRLYLSRWYAVPSTEQLIQEKKKAYDKAKKYII